MAPLPVLYLLDYADLGGGETSFLAVMEALVPPQQKTSMAPVASPLTGRVRPVAIVREAGPVANRLSELAIQTEVVAFPRRLRRGLWPVYDRAAAAQIEAIARREGAGLIHANNFFSMIYSARAARRLGIPLVWTCHGWFELDRPIKRWLARRLPTHITCVSEAVRQETQRRLGREGITTDYLGIIPFEELWTRTAEPGKACPFRSALRSDVRRELGVADKTPLIGVVGRFQPIKGHHYLLQALPELLARLPELQVVFIGDAFKDSAEEQAQKRKLIEMIEAGGWEDRVRLLGFRDDARRLMRGLDALVIPSERESFSMAAVEGLEAGVPVVAPDGWGPREIVKPPQTGLLFEPGDPASLATKIQAALLFDGEGARFDPTAGPRRVHELFTVQAHARRMLALYAELTGMDPDG